MTLSGMLALLLMASGWNIARPNADGSITGYYQLIESTNPWVPLMRCSAYNWRTSQARDCEMGEGVTLDRVVSAYSQAFDEQSAAWRREDLKTIELLDKINRILWPKKRTHKVAGAAPSSK